MRQLSVPITYKGTRLRSSYRIDLIVEDQVVVEVKSVEVLAPVCKAQVLTYLRVTGMPAGLLINFNVPEAHGRREAAHQSGAPVIALFLSSPFVLRCSVSPLLIRFLRPLRLPAQ